MIALAELKAVLIAAPILLLLSLGLTLTLRSGVVGVAGGGGFRRFAGNLTHTVLGMAACLVLLIAIQEMIGFRFGIRW
jgi:hypothetical protein